MNGTFVHNLYIKDGAKYRKTVDINKRIKMLKDIKKLFDEKSIEFFPIFGTLLNFARTQEVVPWDPDIDIGVWYKDHDKIASLKDEIEKLGYKIFIKGSYMSICFAEDWWNVKERAWLIHTYDDGWYYCGNHFHISLQFFIRNGEDVFRFEFFDENIFNKLFGRFKNILINKPNKVLIKLYNFFNGLFNSVVLFLRWHYVFPYAWFKEKTTMKIQGMDFEIPAGYEKFLDFKYGKNWRIPIATNRSLDRAWKLTSKKSRGVKRRYYIEDKKIRDIWIKRGNINIQK